MKYEVHFPEEENQRAAEKNYLRLPIQATYCLSERNCVKL